MTDLFWKPSCCIGDCDEMEDDDKIWGEEEIGSARNHYEKMSRAGTSTASAAPSNLFFSASADRDEPGILDEASRKG